jgi:uncharacterized repeat protein (TIGR01451 family)
MTITLVQKSKLLSALGVFAAILMACLCPATAYAQTVNTYTNTVTGAITDNNCGSAAQITRTFVVPFSYIVSDVDLGLLAAHTYRSDLRITLTSPAGTSVTVMTWTGNVQSGDNFNDRFDDEATAALTTHNATVTDPLTPAPPPYSHSFKPSSSLSAFDGQNALGTWTMVLCDAVASDTGTFSRADLFITSAPAAIVVTKTSSIVTDSISSNNPKAIPSASVRYCVLVTNSGPSLATNVVASDTIPGTLTYSPGTMLSGSSCASAATTEDDNATGTDESDPVGASASGNVITINVSNLALADVVAVTFIATIN